MSISIKTFAPVFVIWFVFLVWKRRKVITKCYLLLAPRPTKWLQWAGFSKQTESVSIYRVQMQMYL